jgi:TonB family protein
MSGINCGINKKYLRICTGMFLAIAFAGLTVKGQDGELGNPMSKSQERSFGPQVGITYEHLENIILQSSSEAEISRKLINKILRDFRNTYSGQSQNLFEWRFLLLDRLYEKNVKFEIAVRLLRKIPYDCINVRYVFQGQEQNASINFIDDPIITQQKVIPYLEFYKICLEAAARSKIRQESIRGILSDFLQLNDRRIVHPLEWRCVLRRQFYEKQISYEHARKFFLSLPLYPVDTGFSDDIRIISDSKVFVPSVSMKKPDPGSPVPEVKEPVLVNEVTPQYTETARLIRAQGVVLLEVAIGKDGRVHNFKVRRSVGYGLEESTIRTIRDKWLFKPATLNGKPIDFSSTIETKFSVY